MQDLHIFRLQPYGAFHFGTNGVDAEGTRERCPSDTVYAALFIEALQRGAPFTDLIDANGVPVFRVSSCLPYYGSTLVLPMPRLKPRHQAETQVADRKIYKKLKYISLSLLRQLLEGESLRDLHEQGTLQQGNTILVAQGEGSTKPTDSWWQMSQIDHVAVDRASQHSQYYAVGQVRFAPQAGLFILADVPERYFESFQALLEHLGESGIGGQRSAGLGQFSVQYDGIQSFQKPTSDRRAMLLSRYIPTLAELEAGVLDDPAAYDIIQLSGWMYSPGMRAHNRKSIRLLTEGSILRCPQTGAPQGLVVDVKPDHGVSHPVWRAGLALTIGIQEAA